MKRYFNLYAPILLFFLLLALVSSRTAIAGQIRPAEWAGRFYPANPVRLAKMIDELTVMAARTRVDIPAHKLLKALILPHAGFIYSGLTAAHASLVLEKNRYEKVILVGPDHRVGFSRSAISPVDGYATPLGVVELHRDASLMLRQAELFQPIPPAADREHSLEVVLPFLQTYLDQFKLVPVVMGRGGILETAGALEALMDQKTLLVVSSDLSHYLPYEAAVARDRDTIGLILTCESKHLFTRENCACGKQPILVLLHMARRRGWQPVLLHYANSGDTAGNRDSVVGYTAIAFYGDATMKKKEEAVYFSEKQGQTLVQLARQTIMETLGRRMDKADARALQSALKDEKLQVHRGTFVTLTIDHQLRGCIGNLTASDPIVDAIRKNAVSAAFHDYRFTPLTPKELDRVAVEISILTEPQPIAYTDGKDLVSKLRVNVDGVIISKGSASATFLPQVWKQLPRPVDFLNHLCRKAGLPSNAWQTASLNVSTYQVQYFEE